MKTRSDRVALIDSGVGGVGDDSGGVGSEWWMEFDKGEEEERVTMLEIFGDDDFIERRQRQNEDHNVGDCRRRQLRRAEARTKRRTTVLEIFSDDYFGVGGR